MTPSGIEPTAFQLVVQCLKQLQDALQKCSAALYEFWHSVQLLKVNM